MGGALLEGWLEVGMAAPAITILDPHPSPELDRLCVARSLRLNPPIGEIRSPRVLVLAIKPQALDNTAPQVDRILGPQTLLISILAGKTIADMRQRIPNASSVVRAMPNLPASIRRGATGAVASGEVDDEGKQVADALLASVGTVEWLASESLLDAVTAVSGSGPAYVFHLAECLAEAGAAAGLPPDLAQRLARATVAGAGELLFQSDLTPDTLRRNVTSPGGTTQAALEVLMANPGLGSLMREAVAAAKQRAEELSG